MTLLETRPDQFGRPGTSTAANPDRGTAANPDRGTTASAINLADPRQIGRPLTAAARLE